MGGDSADGAAASAVARGTGGVAFQAEVFAWWAAHAVAATAPGLGLDESARVVAVGGETGFPVDDVGVELSSGGFILVQAKAGLVSVGAVSGMATERSPVGVGGLGVYLAGLSGL